MKSSGTHGLRLFLICPASFLLFFSASALATERDWANTGTDFNSGSSWSGGTVPGASDVAWFKTGKTTDPFLSSTTTIVGLYFGDKNGGTSSSGYHITSPDSVTHFSLTGTASTTNGAENTNNSAAAIGADNTSGTNTIDAQVRLSGSSNTTQTIYQAAGGTLVINGILSSAVTIKLNLNGGGTLRLAGNNGYTGGTLISAGRLEAAANSALGPSNLTVNSGGTVVLTSNNATNRINNSATVTLAGGTFARSGTGTISEGSGATVVNGNVSGGTNAVGMGALTLSANSTLDFGSDGGRGTLTFLSFVPNNHVLNIVDWVSSNANTITNTSGVDGTDDRLIFDQDQTANLAAFNFGSGLTAAEIALGNGFFEVIPVSEPGTWAAGTLGLSGLLLNQRRRIARSTKR